MRLLSFRVSGYASFVEPVALAPLDEINVLYGPNNCGKTNFINAMELYFRLLGATEGVTREPIQRVENPDRRLAEMLRTAFNRARPEPINFLVNWSLAQSELDRWGVVAEIPCASVTTELELTQVNRSYELRVLRWVLKDQDLAKLDRAKELRTVQFGQQIRRLLADATPFQQDQPVVPLLRSHAEGLFPQDLANRLFDARQSLNPDERKRWSLFSRLSGSLEAELGAGAWDTAFDRTTGQASLVYVNGDEAIRIQSLGSGIQRMLCLLGELCLAVEPWVALEEPEWRLSPDLQRRFVGLATRVLESGVGPKQLFITTHSPVLGNSGKPFAMEVVDGSPVVESKPWAVEGIRGGASEPGLGGLIGLVEELAEMDPDEILPGDKAAQPAKAWAGAR